jgi:hypothetical protein
MSVCYRCGTEVSLDKVGVREVCEKCRAYLHCCRNCEFYEPGVHNDCREPGAELVADKEQGNFCDFFHLASATKPIAASPGADARARLEALFRKKP